MIAATSRRAPVFAALGDATRLHILERLARGGLSIGALTADSGMTRQAVAKHLGVLSRAGLVRDHKRGREHVYEIEAAPVRDVAAWAEEYRRFWDQSLDRLDAYLKSLPTTESEP